MKNKGRGKKFPGGSLRSEFSENFSYIYEEKCPSCDRPKNVKQASKKLINQGLAASKCVGHLLESLFKSRYEK